MQQKPSEPPCVWSALVCQQHPHTLMLSPWLNQTLAVPCAVPCGSDLTTHMPYKSMCCAARPLIQMTVRHHAFGGQEENSLPIRPTTHTHTT
jgi:hypothetical protein